MWLCTTATAEAVKECVSCASPVAGGVRVAWAGGEGKMSRGGEGRGGGQGGEVGDRGRRPG